jgi:hypothetical protein
MTDEPDVGPWHANETVLRHWGWVFDYDDDVGGGFASGEFLITSSGSLLRRHGGSSSSGGQTQWGFGPWEPMREWQGTDLTALVRWLHSRGYGLAEPSPVPPCARHAGPCPGPPSLARPPKDLPPT